MSNVKLPKDIYDKLSQKIIGQEELVKELSILGFLHLARMESREPLTKKETLLIMGDSGSGKTYSVKALAAELNIPFVHVNAKEITSSGWAGTDFGDVMKEVSGQENFAHTLVFIDEFDKVAGNGDTRNDHFTTGTQAALLTALEGGDVRYSNNKQELVFNTSKMLFILGGAFTQLRKERENRNQKQSIGFIGEKNDFLGIVRELEEAGIIKEIVGRITSIVETKPTTIDDLKRMVTNPFGLLAQYEAFLPLYNLRQFELTEEDYAELEERAKKSNTGGRLVDSFIYDKVKNLIFEDAEILEPVLGSSTEEEEDCGQE